MLGLWFGFAALTILGGLTATVAVLGWFACLARGRMPRGMRDAAAYGCGYGAQTTAYALMLTAGTRTPTPTGCADAPSCRRIRSRSTSATTSAGRGSSSSSGSRSSSRTSSG